MEYILEFVDKISQADEDRMTRDLVAYESAHGIDVNFKRFSVVLKEDQGTLLGVINAFTAFAEIYIEDFWVDSRYRRQGLGKKLLQSLEDHFKGKGFNNINLVTNAFQAVEFYKKCGYQQEFVRVNQKNPQLTKTFFVKFFEDEVQTQGLLQVSEKKELVLKNPLIRPLDESDIPKIVKRYSFSWSSPEKTRALWEGYFHEQLSGMRTVAVIEENREILGYGSFLRKGESPFFARQAIPEINAVWIDEKHHRQGLGTALIMWIENLAKQEGYKKIGIGVGLYADYGPAQRLYLKLGYNPDGNGVTYKSEPTTPGQSYPLDDDLILWLVKDLG